MEFCWERGTSEKDPIPEFGMGKPRRGAQCRSGMASPGGREA